MRWAEVIMVRLAGSNDGILDTTLKALLSAVVIETEMDRIRVFRHEKLNSDICIFLFHNGEKAGSGGSLLGLNLAAAFNEVGLVNHTIWRDILR